MKQLLQFFRTKDYIKNVLLFFPAFFGGSIIASNYLYLLTASFFVFCLLASAVYIINDLFDIKFDTRHPQKKHKLLASQKISTGTCAFIVIALLFVAFIGAYFTSISLLCYCLLYLAINLIYSAFGKHIPLLDLLLITIGFLLRLQSGAVVSHTPISWWLYAMIILLALGFGLAKRLEEINLLVLRGIPFSEVRPSLKFYSKVSVQQGIVLIILIAVSCYSCYTLNPDTIARLGSSFVFITCLPVWLGAYSYIRLITEGKKSIAPQTVLKENTSIQLSLLCWLTLMAYFIYR
ncbi:MAG: UbiA prenyltransferase family protein [Bacteroidetes bacterium]|nr:UbiA prenyltransferase family protein [Bacteroidota bacterium]